MQLVAKAQLLDEMRKEVKEVADRKIQMLEDMRDELRKRADALIASGQGGAQGAAPGIAKPARRPSQMDASEKKPMEPASAPLDKKASDGIAPALGRCAWDASCERGDISRSSAPSARWRGLYPPSPPPPVIG